MIWNVHFNTIRLFCKNTASKNIMEVIAGKKLINCSGKAVSVEKALRGKEVVLFYFSASWCNPCKMLLPQIKHVYSVAKERKTPLEIIYVSSDTEPDIFLEYYQSKHGTWYAMKFNDPLAEEVRQIYSITSIPVIYVVRVADGKVISSNGRMDIEKLGENALVTWLD